MFLTYTYEKGNPIKELEITDGIKGFRKCVLDTSETLFQRGKVMRFFLKVLIFPVRRKMLDNVTEEVGKHYVEISFPLYNFASGIISSLVKLDKCVVGAFQIAYHIKERPFLATGEDGKVTYHKDDKSKD